MEADFFPMIFLPFFLLVWLAVSRIISQASGWHALAERYQVMTPPSDIKNFYLRSGVMRMSTRYNGCLNFGINNMGLKLSVMPMFRFAHPTLFIPWTDIKISISKSGIFKIVRFDFPDGIYLTISYRFAQKLFSGFRHLLPPEETGQLIKN